RCLHGGDTQSNAAAWRSDPGGLLEFDESRSDTSGGRAKQSNSSREESTSHIRTRIRLADRWSRTAKGNARQRRVGTGDRHSTIGTTLLRHGHQAVPRLDSVSSYFTCESAASSSLDWASPKFSGIGEPRPRGGPTG